MYGWNRCFFTGQENRGGRKNISGYTTAGLVPEVRIAVSGTCTRCDTRDKKPEAGFLLPVFIVSVKIRGLFHSLFYGHGYGYRSADHRVVAHAEETHHLYVCGNRRRACELSVASACGPSCRSCRTKRDRPPCCRDAGCGPYRRPKRPRNIFYPVSVALTSYRCRLPDAGNGSGWSSYR